MEVILKGGRGREGCARSGAGRSVRFNPTGHLEPRRPSLRRRWRASERAPPLPRLLLLRWRRRKSFVVLIIGNSESDHLGAQGTLNPTPPSLRRRWRASERAPPLLRLLLLRWRRRRVNPKLDPSLLKSTFPPPLPPPPPPTHSTL